MNKLFCSFLSFLILCTGCTPTYKFYPLSSERCDQINERADGQTGRMTIMGYEEELAVEDIRVDPDSTNWTDSNNQSQMNASTDVIQDITIKDRRKGRAIGLTLGGLSIVIGAAILIGSKSDEPKDHIEEMGQDLVQAWGILCLGIGIGTAVGLSMIGIDHEYILNDPDEWVEFQAIEDLLDDDREEEALSALNEIINSSEDDQKRAIALFFKIKYNLDNPTAEYDKLKAEFPDNIYTSLAESLLFEEE